MEAHIDSCFGLAEALQVIEGDLVSVVGAGGKTAVLYGLASELRHRGFTVVTTTTTHMQTPRYATTAPPLVYVADEADWVATVRDRLARYGSATVVGTRLREDKLRGLEPAEVGSLRGLADCVIVEADGARGRSLKAPASHEPVFPEETSLTVVVAGIDALGTTLDEATVHRLEVVCRLTSAPAGSLITEEIMAATLARGYLPRVPARSRRVFFLNKADDSHLKQAEAVGCRLLELGAPVVVFGEARFPNHCFYRMVPPRA